MKDPARIDRVISKLRREWHANPDLRLMQLLVNSGVIEGGTDDEGRFITYDPYHTEDDEIERKLDQYRETSRGSSL